MNENIKKLKDLRARFKFDDKIMLEKQKTRKRRTGKSVANIKVKGSIRNSGVNTPKD